MKAARVRAAFALVALVLATSPTVAAVNVQFDYRYDTTGFFTQGTASRACLLAAADFYESLLDDHLTAIESGGKNQFDVVFSQPNNGAITTITDFDIPLDTLVIFVGARELGGSTLGLAGPGGWSARYQDEGWFDNIQTRGQGEVEDIVGDAAIDTAPWGGSIALDTTTTWNTDHTKQPSYPNSDLYSVLVHELAHVLGLGLADSWDNLIDASERFTGAASVAEYGGAVPLQSGGGHWASGTNSTVFANGVSQQASMTPTITTGTRKRATDLDVAGLDDLGWDINPVDTWNNVGGGVFSTAANWSTHISPTTRDTIEFALANTYTVTFAADQACQQAEVRNGHVTFDLGGGTFTVDYLLLSTSTASLRLTNGELALLDQGVVQSGFSFLVGGGGTLRVDGGLHGALTVESGGELTGSGHLDQSVTNGGRVSPGNGVGALAIGQSFVQQTAGVLSVELGGLDQGTEFELLDVASTVSLAGTLEVLFVDGFMPGLGDAFEVMTYSSRSGVFSHISGDDASNNLVLVPDYGSESLVLVATVLGDANLDGRVDDVDASILASHWRATNGTTWKDGDFNNDGAVTEIDASILASHWHVGVEALGVVVPEPASWMLLLGALCCVATRFTARRAR